MTTVSRRLTNLQLTIKCEISHTCLGVFAVGIPQLGVACP